MPNELTANYNGSATLYAMLRRLADGYVWNGSAFVVWSDGSIASYDIPLASLGGDLYAADMPDVAAGNYRADFYVQDGGTPATTDLRLPGNTFYWSGSAVLAPPSGGADGYYADQSDLESRFGVVNLAALSNLDNTTATVDASRVQLALEEADSTIDRILRRNNYAYPASASIEDFDKLTHAACDYAMAWLYERRRWRDESGTNASEADSHTKSANATMRELMVHGMTGAARLSSGWPDYPVAVA